MKTRSATVLLSLTLAMLLGPFAVQAEGLNSDQEEVLRQHLSQMPAEQVDQIRNDPSARLKFLRSIAAEMSPEQREAFRECWKSMTLDQRQEVLAKL